MGRQLRTLSFCCLVSCLVLGVSALSAKRAPPRRVGLILEPARARDADKVGQLTLLLEAELARRGIARGRLLGSFDTMGLAEGRRLLKKAVKQLASDHNLAQAEAIEGAFTGALLNLKSSLGSVRIDELVATYTGMAATRLAQKDRRLALEYLTTALNLKPALTEGDFFGARPLRDLFVELRASLPQLGSGSVKLESTPSGAEVYLGDTLAGYTPLTLTALRSGTHLVRLRREGFYEHGFLATVDKGGTTKLRHSLKPMAGRGQLDAWRKTLYAKRSWKKLEKIADAVFGIRRLLRVSDLIVARVKRTRNGYHLVGAYSPRRGEPVRIDLVIPVDGQLLDNVRSFLSRAVPARRGLKKSGIKKTPPKNLKGDNGSKQ